MNAPHYIPYVNNYALLEKAYNSCKHYDYVYVIDNREPHKREPDPKNLGYRVRIIKPPVHLSTAQIMNFMLAITYETYFTWQHCDVNYEPHIFDNFKAYVESRQGYDWGIMYTSYDYLAAYNCQPLRNIGGWDALRFPWYFLDNDIALRLIDNGYKIVQMPDSGQINHEYSSTIRSDDERNYINSRLFPLSELFFNDKWANRDKNYTTTKDYN
jgi:GT2 family glycosyltransferase